MGVVEVFKLVTEICRFQYYRTSQFPPTIVNRLNGILLNLWRVSPSTLALSSTPKTFQLWICALNLHVVLKIVASNALSPEVLKRPFTYEARQSQMIGRHGW